MLAGLLLLLLLTGKVSPVPTVVYGQAPERVCSYQDVLNYLNLTKDNELFSMTRPVKDYKQPTEVSLEVLLYAILDVREIDQKFVSYVWVFTGWQNEYIQWNPEDFCGIDHISLPTDVLWMPDISIEEMTEKDKAPPSPHLIVLNHGTVIVKNDQVLVSTCRMHVHNFPFDTQSCNLSFKSVVHSVDEIRLIRSLSSAEATLWSREVMLTQYEWLFINMTVTNETANMFGLKQDMMIFTVSMKRRSALYVVNFLLPILFFFSLDLASFLISDIGGEKLSFKVTVLLAVTVMQLILNEILPSSSDKIPLIAIYCIGIFGLMMLSLLETILVMHLMEKDSRDNAAERESEGCNKKDKADRKDDEKKWTSCICDVSADETPAELLKGSSSQLTEESHSSEKLSDELRDVLKTLTLVLNNRKDEGKPGYWTRKAKTINKCFFIFYIIAASLFLLCMFLSWSHA
ncbi:5-hydroxytryptamine receptor 3A-like [Chelmon rostratus]|uniref:5-hydroxytryptamine receptor 3A-like n=1 Tax=Chelmon rostratus TaxID=109905 RepID=UPI001BEBCDE3|nr:5-hydroxytryptamine receptor 3A-like [Chelmon rostratus]